MIAIQNWIVNFIQFWMFIVILSLYREIDQKTSIFGWFWCNQSNHPKMDDCWAPIIIQIWKRTLRFNCTDFCKSDWLTRLTSKRVLRDPNFSVVWFPNQLPYWKQPRPLSSQGHGHLIASWLHSTTHTDSCLSISKWPLPGKVWGDKIQDYAIKSSDQWQGIRNK